MRSHDPEPADLDDRLVRAEWLLLRLPRDVDVPEQLEVRQHVARNVCVGDDAVAARRGEHDRQRVAAARLHPWMPVDDRREVVLDDDHMHARVRPRSRLVPRQRRAGRLVDRERERRGAACGHRLCRLEAGELVGVRGLDRQILRVRRRASRDERQHEEQRSEAAHRRQCRDGLGPASPRCFAITMRCIERARAGLKSGTGLRCTNEVQRQRPRCFAITMRCIEHARARLKSGTGLRCTNEVQRQSPRCFAITMRCTSFVPSPISRIFWSR